MPPSSILAHLRCVVHRSDIAVALLFVGALRYRICCRHHANSLFLNVCWHYAVGSWQRQIAWTAPFPLADRTESSNRLPCTVGTLWRAYQEAWHCPRGPWGGGASVYATRRRQTGVQKRSSVQGGLSVGRPSRSTAVSGSWPIQAAGPKHRRPPALCSACWMVLEGFTAKVVRRGWVSGTAFLMHPAPFGPAPTVGWL